MLSLQFPPPRPDLLLRLRDLSPGVCVGLALLVGATPWILLAAAILWLGLFR